MKITQFLRAMEMLRKEFGGEYAPQQLSILLWCAVRPGITHTELAKMLDMPQGTVSRNVTKLAERIVTRNSRPVKVGYGLVENRIDEVYDSRRSAVFLTSKGKQFIAKVKNAITED